MTTHLMKLGPALPYQAQTECGMTVDTLAIVSNYPTCNVCASIDCERILDAMEERAELEIAWRRRNAS